MGGTLNGAGPRLVIVLKLAGHLNTRRASNSLFEIVNANDTTYELLCFLIVQSYEFLLSYEFLFFLIVLFALLLVLLLDARLLFAIGQPIFTSSSCAFERSTCRAAFERRPCRASKT